jgi:hypothetical protein
MGVKSFAEKHYENKPRPGLAGNKVNQACPEQSRMELNLAGNPKHYTPNLKQDEAAVIRPD